MTPPPARPCGHGAPANDKGKGKGNDNGMVLILPLALGGLVAAARARLVRSARGVGRRRIDGEAGPGSDGRAR